MAIAPECSFDLPSEMAEAAESISFKYLTTVLTECEEISIYFEEESKEIEETFLSSCKKCERPFTTKTGLKRHLKVCKKEEEVEGMLLTVEKVLNLVEEVKLTCQKDECFLKDFKEAVCKTCNTLDINSKILKNYLDRLKPLAIAYRDSQNNNIFWQKYLSFIKDIHILFASQSNTNKKAASYIIMKLGEKILVEWKRFIKKQTAADTPAATNNTATTDFEIAQRDKDILEYLGGYVMQHLYRKIKKSPQYGSDKNIKVCNILKAGKSKTIEHRRLVNCKSRGGLWRITTSCFNIFKVAETVFTSHARVENFSKFHLEAMIEEISMNENVISSFEVMLEDAIVEVKDNEIGEQVLQTMIKLYVRVRAFSHAKKVTESHALKQKSHID